MPKISKNGNSLTVTLPAHELEAMGLKQGDEVQWRRRGGILELVPVEIRPRLVSPWDELYEQTKSEFGTALERLAK